MSELDDAIAAVSAEVMQEYTVEEPQTEEAPPAEPAKEETTPEPETPPEKKEATPEETAKEEPARERDEHGRFVPKKKEEPEAEDEEEDDLGLTAEELAAINADERLARVYKSIQRGATKKFTSVAEQKKALAERGKLIDWLQAEPQKAARAIAVAAGLKVADDEAAQDTKAVSDTADELEALYTKTFGEQNKEAAGKLRALFEKTAEAALAKRFNADIEALKKQVEQHNQAAAARGITAAKQEFEAKVRSRGGEWSDAIESEMAAQVARMEPGTDDEGNPVTIDEFLQDVYDVVMYRRSQKSAKREELKRLRRVREEQEPTNAVRPAKTTPARVTPDMAEKDAIALAVQLAEQEAQSR